MDKLLPCAFCGQPPHEVHRKRNPYARCITEGCMGSKLPMVSLDLQEDIDSWNTRHTPEGWQLVPVEPRKEQLDAFNAADKWLHSNDGAGYLAASSFDGAKGEPYYKAMLAAAPKWGGG